MSRQTKGRDRRDRMKIEDRIADITNQIAESLAQQLDAHLQDFLKRSMIPFDGDIRKTNSELEAKGMRLIREDYPIDGFGDRTTTYMLVKILDSTTVTVKAPTLTTPTNKEEN